ncbi:hypothetical protein [Serratia symbiotica]|uniref:hypothetical protein n=1 Tax=Serratia symbiotica TaxID=138074 RepID=UPI0030D1C213
MYALPERCPFTGLFIPNPIYSTTPSSLYLLYYMDCINVFLYCVSYFPVNGNNALNPASHDRYLTASPSWKGNGSLNLGSFPASQKLGNINKS